MGPFEHHLRDAIALNLERAPLYAALSGGASRRISRRLILAERALLPVARWFDRRASPYHEAGVPLLEALFEPMSTAPAFAPAPHLEIPAPERTQAGGLRPAAVRRTIRLAYRGGSFGGAAAVLAGELALLTSSPATDCLVRHLLESAERVASLAPQLIHLATERGLASPHRLLAQLLWLHLWGLDAAASVDALARPLQLRGIAILAQDLPPIQSSRQAP